MTTAGHPSRRTVLLAAGAALALAGQPAPAHARPGSAAARPYASYWYPDSLPAGSPGPGITWRSLKEWRAETDPDLAFNAAAVPLADRFTPVPANGTARAGQARVQALVSFGPTSSHPSQGSATADYYALTHWAYIDELVFWGGSSGEGLILAPNAPVVDAAHRHGVPVLARCSCRPRPTAGSCAGPATSSSGTPPAGTRWPRDSSPWPRPTASTAGSSTPRPAGATPRSAPPCWASSGN